MLSVVYSVKIFAFFTGTQSRNPHNDYSQNFVDTGQRPQNFIRDVGLADRFEVTKRPLLKFTFQRFKQTHFHLIFPILGVSEAQGIDSLEE